MSKFASGLPRFAGWLILGVILGGIGLIIYRSYPPESSSLFPRCSFYALTGWKCPGCGSQRMLHHLLNGNFADAFRSNALILISLPYLLVLGSMNIPGVRERFPRLRQAISGRIACLTVFTVIVLWWILRNIFSW
jgi:hypothetical protein